MHISMLRMASISCSNVTFLKQEACKSRMLSLFLLGLPSLKKSTSIKIIRLTTRFHVPVHLSFNRSQMTSKCGKNKKVAHEAIAECVTDVLFVLYNKELNFVRIKAALFHVRRAKVGRSPF